MFWGVQKKFGHGAEVSHGSAFFGDGSEVGMDVEPKIGENGPPTMDGENNGEKNPMNKWMIWGGKTTPIFGNTRIFNESSNVWLKQFMRVDDITTLALVFQSYCGWKMSFPLTLSPPPVVIGRNGSRIAFCASCCVHWGPHQELPQDQCGKCLERYPEVFVTCQHLLMKDQY